MQLCKNPTQVSPDCPLADTQLISNILCCIALYDQHRNLQLSFSQCCNDIWHFGFELVRFLIFHYYQDLLA